MKRSIVILLALALTLSLAACGGVSDGEIKEPGNVSVGDQTEDVQQTQGLDQSQVTISEAVLVDEAGVKITAKSFSSDTLFGPEVKLLIENNSGKNLTFQCRDASVNGYMVGTMMSTDVVNGKKANDGLTFMKADLEACGINVVADMEFAFRIFETESWEDYLDTEMIQIKTSAADTYQYTYDDSGDVVYDGNGLKIVVKGLVEDQSIFGPGVVVYIENNGDKGITVQTRDVSINGFMVDALFSCDVAAGKRAVDTITFMETELEENGITAIDEIELSFHVFDMETWDGIVDTETVKIGF